MTAPAGTGCMRQPLAIQEFCGLDPKWVAPFSTSWVFLPVLHGVLFCTTVAGRVHRRDRGRPQRHGVPLEEADHSRAIMASTVAVALQEQAEAARGADTVQAYAPAAASNQGHGGCAGYMSSTQAF